MQEPGNNTVTSEEITVTDRGEIMLCGTIVGVIEYVQRENTLIHINEIFVDEPYRDQGIGTIAIKQFTEEMQRTDAVTEIETGAVISPAFAHILSSDELDYTEHARYVETEASEDEIRDAWYYTKDVS